METIFDHQITQAELEALAGPLDWTREDFEKFSQESNYANIYRLYIYRGDFEKAENYLSKVKTKNYKLFSLCNHDLPRL